jgi:ribosome-associated heat shock protein Hsp15
VEGERQRLDRFLWHARLVRTRPLAAKLVAAGHVRVNGQRTRAPGRGLKVGDVITATLGARVRVLKARAFAPRRGGSAAASDLYEDLSPPAPEPDMPPAADRAAGHGRPTKRERRQLAQLLERDFGSGN